MKSKFAFVIAFLSTLICTASAVEKTVSLNDVVVQNIFVPATIGEMRTMKSGESYTMLVDDTKIVKYSYKTGKEEQILLDITKLNIDSLITIDGYSFDAKEENLLVYKRRASVYRHSFLADYYYYDIRHEKIESISDKGPQRIASISPDGFYIAYVQNNNLYINNLRYKTTTQVTTDGEENKILNGIPDWVYEEEFSFTKAYEWSPDGRMLAYIRFDQRGVKDFSFQRFGGMSPTIDSLALYPGYARLKYPKAGEVNSKVEVRVYDIANRADRVMQVAEPNEDFYVPRIKWTATSERLAILKLNRRQDNLKILLANPKSTVTQIVYNEQNSKYIDDTNFDFLTFTPDNLQFVFANETDGFNHLYLYSIGGKQIQQLTKGKWDVTDFYGYDVSKMMVYYQAATKSPIRREVYATSLKGKTTPLAIADGTNSATFSSNYNYFVHRFSSITTPDQFAVCDIAGKVLHKLEQNNILKTKLSTYTLAKKSFIKVPNGNGDTLNGWIVYPRNMESTQKYPLLMVQYSGPNSQEVRDRWKAGWEFYLAEQGYVVACIDGRGTGARGEAFRKCTYMNIGKLESQDQLSAAKYLATQKNIDGNRMGIWGWSYGGYMSALCLSTGETVFKAAIAVAPVTSFKFYDTVYTERYMRTPGENGDGYQFCPLNLAKALKGKLLLIHGTADDNVHYQNTIEYAEALVQANIQFDMMSYNNRNHDIRGGNTRLHLYTKKIDWLEWNLKGAGR